MKKRKKICLWKKISIIFFCIPFFVFGDTEVLESKIKTVAENIKALEEEILKEEKKIEEIQSTSKTLQGAIGILDAEIKKTSYEIRVNESKITSATKEILNLSKGINAKSDSIQNILNGVSNLIKELNRIEKDSFIENILKFEEISEVWESADSLIFAFNELKKKTEELKNIKEELEDSKTKEEKKKQELIILKNELADRKKIIEINKSEKNQLLKDTKNKESNYKTILTEKLALKNAFEKELWEFERQLQLEIDPNSIPKANKGILGWPVDKVRITQKFGKTDFSAKNPGLYGSSGHNGVDFGATTGSIVRASEGGIVEGAGDTDLVCRGASYGKWILIRHNNGLSTIYAHLSLLKVSKGQSVSRGELIGYVGSTGYSTGPHLHFSVLASQGVKVMNVKSKVCGGTYTQPVADLRAYLDPLEYL